jgi:hypothetical protein
MRLFSGLFIWLVLFAGPAISQDRSDQQVTSAFAILTTPVESKNAVIGQELTFRTVADVVVKDVVVIPRGSTILARVSDVRTKDKDQTQSAIAVVIEKAKRADGIEIRLQAIIAAVAAPKDGSLSSDPAYGMMHSNEPRMSGSGAGNTSRTGDLAPASKAAATAAVATAGLKGAMEEGFVLNENSTGVIGYEGLALSWGLAAPPPFTVLVSKNKNFKLSAGSQVLLRMAPPHLPQ